MKLLPFLAALTIFTVTAQAENWPSFRGPIRQGASTETNLPLKWSASEKVAWKTPIPGEAWSSPVVWGERVFVTTATDNGKSCRVLALETKDGRIAWDREVFTQEPGNKQSKNSYATPTPATDGERVYAVFGDGSFAALNMDGTTAWTNRDFKFYSQHGLGASPLLYEDLLIMSFDGSSTGPDKKIGWQVPWEEAVILALDKKTGKERWRAKRGPSRIAHVSPVVIRVGDRDELLSCAGDAIQGFDPKTGERLWHIYSQGEGVVPSPVLADGLIVTASGFEKSTVRAVRTGGRGDVTKTHIAWEQRKGVPSMASLVTTGGRIYAVTDGGIVTCFDAKDGRVVWQDRIGGAHSASPIIADGRIYFLSEEGETTVLEAGDTYKVLAKNPLGERCQASMAASGQRIFIRSATHLWGIAP